MKKLQDLKALKQVQEESLQAWEAAGETPVSTTDPDARLLNKKGQTIAGYNVQIGVDAQHQLASSRMPWFRIATMFSNCSRC